ncbi:MAG: ScpA family protein [Bowdeniella nasicola]|nr:ScpA family protein [Bowdeniella nasicola]
MCADASAPDARDNDTFVVDLDVFSGPFDLLLSLIARHRLDVTEVALAEVTDEFLSYAFANRQEVWDLSQASEFLVVAATLLDLKAMRLLPRDGTETEEDLELLEARDLLFARLLQYRAYKEVSGYFAERLSEAGAAEPRSVPMEPQFAALLPELIWSIGPEELARVAADVFSRDTSTPVVSVDHLHHPVVPVFEQAQLIVETLKMRPHATFAELVAGERSPAVIVARFLALLDLYRDALIDVAQDGPDAALMIRYLGDADTQVRAVDEYEAPDQPEDDDA